jgi:hypothetical protein
METPQKEFENLRIKVLVVLIFLEEIIQAGLEWNTLTYNFKENTDKNNRKATNQ